MENSVMLKDVRVFDGNYIHEKQNIIIAGSKISMEGNSIDIIDCKGLTVLPGLIDSHIHIDNIENIHSSNLMGITTMLDMGTRDVSTVNNAKHIFGVENLLSCYKAGSSKGSYHDVKMGYPVVDNEKTAKLFVEEQIKYGADYIKIILDDPKVPGAGKTNPDTITAIVKHAHNHRKLVIAHTVADSSYLLAVDNGVDILTHVPMGELLSKETISLMKSRNVSVIPTLVMMKGLFDAFSKLPIPPPWEYDFARKNVISLKENNIQLLAGTDANNDPNSPYKMEYGNSLYKEFDLLIEAKLSPIEVLKSATSIPAKIFDLKERGEIKNGYRADLLLVDGDPTRDINCLKNIKAVWKSGIRIK
jgi:imidazolonepropionase-like amidohydrolase